MFELIGEVGAVFSQQLSTQTQFAKYKKVIFENQCDKHKKSSFFILFFYQRTNLDPVSIKYLADIGPSARDLRLRGCIIRKGRFIFMKERRIIRQSEFSR